MLAPLKVLEDWHEPQKSGTKKNGPNYLKQQQQQQTKQPYKGMTVIPVREDGLLLTRWCRFWTWGTPGAVWRCRC